MATRFTRPAGAYDSTSVTTNKDKFQTDSSGSIAISSAKVDGDFNKIIDNLNAVDDDVIAVNALTGGGGSQTTLTNTLTDFESRIIDNNIDVDTINALTGGGAGQTTLSNTLTNYESRVTTNAADIAGVIAAGLPSQVGNADKTVITNGSTVSWQYVDTANIAVDAVTTAKILDANVTTGKLADNSVNTAKMTHGTANNVLKYDGTGVPVEGTVDTDNLTDNSVTLTKMAGITAGNIIAGDASNNPAYVATGTVGQVLTSGGAGAAPTMQDAGSVPVGAMMDFAGSVAPVGWFLRDGAAVSRTTYADLFTIVGVTYGAGDGSTTFNLPDTRGRVLTTLDNLGGTSANVMADAQADVLGGKFGVESGVGGATALSVAQLASHNHSFTAYDWGNFGARVANTLDTINASAQYTSSTGSNQSHTHTENRVQPSMAITGIIKY